jgi:hypothetical protein
MTTFAGSIKYSHTRCSGACTSNSSSTLNGIVNPAFLDLQVPTFEQILPDGSRHDQPLSGTRKGCARAFTAAVLLIRNA